MKKINNPDKIPTWCPLLLANKDVPMMCRACDNFEENPFGRSFCREVEDE